MIYNLLTKDYKLTAEEEIEIKGKTLEESEQNRLIKLHKSTNDNVDRKMFKYRQKWLVHDREWEKLNQEGHQKVKKAKSGLKNARIN